MGMSPPLAIPAVPEPIRARSVPFDIALENPADHEMKRAVSQTPGGLPDTQRERPDTSLPLAGSILRGKS